MEQQRIEAIIHDARKPLNHITMHAEILKLMLEDPANSAELKVIADKIIKAAKESSAIMQTLVNK